QHWFFSTHLMLFILFFFFPVPPSPDFFTLSLHDALPISARRTCPAASSSPAARSATAWYARPCTTWPCAWKTQPTRTSSRSPAADRKSTRLELQSRFDIVCRLLLEKKKTKRKINESNK